MAGEKMMLDLRHIALDIIVVSIFAALVLALRRIWPRVKASLLHPPLKNEVLKNREIYSELVALRALTDSDRAYVFRFHNGMEFLPNNPAWKLSCTHEVVRHGVTYESPRLQGMLVSLIPDIIYPVITGQSNMPGIAVKRCSDCPFEKKCLAEGKRVIILSVNDMAGSYCRFHMESENNKTTIICGIAFGGTVYGIVGVDFCGVAIPEEKIHDVCMRVCRSADIIHSLIYYGRLVKIPPEPITGQQI